MLHKVVRGVLAAQTVNAMILKIAQLMELVRLREKKTFYKPSHDYNRQIIVNLAPLSRICYSQHNQFLTPFNAYRRFFS